MLRQPSQTNQHHVAVAQPDAVMVVVRMAYFPENSTIPIRFKDDAAFPRLPADEAIRLFDDFSVVKQRASFGQIAVVAGRVGHLPAVGYVAVNVDQINFAAAVLRRKQGKAGKRSIVIARSQPDTGALCLDLFYGRHRFSSYLPFASMTRASNADSLSRRLR
jgi:hypothetical protein